MIKASPALTQRKGGDGAWIDGGRLGWFCEDIADWWDLDGFSRIWICGSSDYVPGCIEARPHILTTKVYKHHHGLVGPLTDVLIAYWSGAEAGQSRMPRYADWLRSFKAPCVWVWIEGKS